MLLALNPGSQLSYARRRHSAKDLVADAETTPRERTQGIDHTLKSLLSALAAKDPYTFEHSTRVAELARRLARELCPRNPAFNRRVYTAGLLHDVGKIGIPVAILHKEGPLTDTERACVQTHPRLSASLLAAHMDRETVVMVMSHHEHWDGKGYPNGLQGASIPFGSRIIAVADAYDAMTSTRPYRVAMKPEDALSILRAGAGTQWDDLAVAALLSLV